MLNLKKRLILDADINFDTAGTGEEVTFFGQDGKSYSGKKINASHMPLTAETRKKVAVGNVDQALSLLSDKVNNIAADDVLTSDVTVVFEAEDAFDVIQDKINQQKKNLNGHTLTFVFPASLSQILYSTIIWQDFYNGTVKITGGTADRLISIYDQLDITALFRFYRCQCEVIVEYFHFIHQYSVYAIFAESSTAVIAKNCTFTGMSDADSYAIKLQASGGAFDNCLFNDDIQLDVIYNTGSAAGGHYLGEVFAYSGAVPPEGAYLLNGQTITECSELYPKFWEWLVEGAAEEMTEVPVYKKWRMPFLNSDGEIGGDVYAVHMPLTGSMTYRNDAPIYKSFDFYRAIWGNVGYVYGADGRAEIIYYSPQKLKLSQVDFQTPVADYDGNIMVNRYTLQASNDNVSWVDFGEVGITDFNITSVFKINIPDSKYSASVPGYKYFKFICENNAWDMQFHEITLHGEEYLYTANIGRKYILTMDNATFDNIKKYTGMCGGFVIDSATGNVRLPDYRGGTIWGGDAANIGQSLIAGIPDIDLALRVDSAVENPASRYYKKVLPEYGIDDWAGTIAAMTVSADEPVYAMSSGDRTRAGDLLKPEEYGRSDTIQPPATCVSFCIQVFNAATALSEQQSAQFASQIQMRMQTDLSNGVKATLAAIETIMPESIDYVIEQKEAADGSWWYEKRRSGKVYQGGKITNNNLFLSFPVELRDLPLSVSFAQSGEASGSVCRYAIASLSTTGIMLEVSYENMRTGAAFYTAVGYAATE